MHSQRSPEYFLNYRNEKVISRYIKEHGTDKETAEKVFIEMLKFLYLCVILPTPCSPPSRAIDDMWHCFILHTPDYFEFCREYAGRFLHHDPTETPYIANREEMISVAEATFGQVNSELWRHLLSEDIAGCNNYCTENCSGGGCTNRVFLENPPCSNSIHPS